jgi:ATP-binding cassette subfamily B protein
VLLEAPSGAGKSTLASVIAGLRRADAGLLLAGGLDHATLGERGWRRRIALAPQFHDNHIFLGSLAFNLLMARAWPPSRDDLDEARALCVELGLGPTLDQMPAGVFEMVGETGWRLSHGERSRVYLARALLSRAPLVVLDESLAALDPQTLVDVVACVERRTRAALVIAHP